MNTIKRMRPCLGTFVEIGFVAGFSAVEEQGFTHAFARLELIHQLLSFHSLDSDLSRLNRARGDWVECHPLSIRCLQLAMKMTRSSEGLFNCTLGASLVQRGVLPAHDFKQCYGDSLLLAGTAADVIIEGRKVRLARPVLVTLDGIAKGFAVDAAVLQLKMIGINSGWVNAGGDIRIFGELIAPISVRDHLGQEHVLGGIQNAAIATSTSVCSQAHPGLLLSPEGESLSAGTWTILSHFAWRADALTKVAANLPASLSSAEREIKIAQLGGRWLPLIH